MWQALSCNPNESKFLEHVMSASLTSVEMTVWEKAFSIFSVVAKCEVWELFFSANEGSWRTNADYTNFESEEVRMVLVYLISMFLVPFCFFSKKPSCPFKEIHNSDPVHTTHPVLEKLSGQWVREKKTAPRQQISKQLISEVCGKYRQLLEGGATCSQSLSPEIITQKLYYLKHCLAH